MNDQFETLTEQIHMKDHNAMAAKGEMQSLVQQMDEKEKAKRAWQRYLEIDRDSVWAAEARKRLSNLE